MIRLFVPGRLCLFGEHSDWAGAYRTTHPALSPGHCLVAGTDQGLDAEAEPLPGDFEIATGRSGDDDERSLRIPARVETLAATARAGGFFSYAAGTAAEVTARHRVGGLRLRVTTSDLPVAKGLSSSAAICVLVARAYARVYGLGLSTRDEMRIAHAGERRAGSACGLMDQVCAFGRRTVLLTFDGDAFDVEPVVPGGAFHLLVVDLGRGKDTRRILTDLNACFPDTPGPLATAVRDALGPGNAALVIRARAALGAGDAPALGALMVEAQALFDRHVAPASPELAAPRLHEVLAHDAVRALAWGGKGVGSQGDGCAQLVTRGPAERDALADRLVRDLGVACLPLTLDPDRQDARAGGQAPSRSEAARTTRARRP
jgi:galactokinase